MRKNRAIAALLGLAGVASAAVANEGVIVTEVFYNPSGDEAETEWVEITNVGNQPVDVSDYVLDDEDGSTPSHRFGSGGIRLPDGTILEPNEAPECTGISLGNGGGIQCPAIHSVILMPGESMVVGSYWDQRFPFSGNNNNAQVNTFEDFVASWGEDTDDDGIGDTVGYKICLLLGQITIANTASETNEVLELSKIIDNVPVIQDFVNYQVGSSSNLWPFSSNGRSIYLQPNFYSSSDEDRSVGAAWALSIAGIDGVIEGRLVESEDIDDGDVFTLYGEGDAASPGFAPTLAESFVDLNDNGRDDALDIFLGNSLDCNRNRVPDEVEADGNGNGIPDGCELQLDQELDCDGNGIPDDIDIMNGAADSDGDGTLDVCEGTDGVIITEIMFNPSGSEREWIELLNTTDAPIDMENYFFQDLDQPVFDGPEQLFPAFTLEPGGVAVIGEVSPEDWEAAWGTPEGYQYIQVSFLSLANNADLVNEVRTLNKATDVTVDGETGDITVNASVRVDVANYQSTTSNGVPQGGWPGDDGRSSFYVVGEGNFNKFANNEGENWSLSLPSLNGAFQATRTNRFDGRDIGSPGFVNTGTPDRPSGEIIISEINFATNSDFPPGPFGPDGPNGIDEWVEIVNTSGAAIDLEGWYLADEDGETTPVPAGVTLGAGEAMVLFGADRQYMDFNPTPVAEFYTAWGCGYQAVGLESWYTDLINPGLDRLGDAAEGGTGTNPSTGREILRLVKPDGVLADVVNYDDDGFVWPLVANGLPANPAFSIFVFSSANYDELSNDDGFSWGTSFPGFRGGVSNTLTTVYNAPQFGSPGFVFDLTPALDPGACVSPEVCYADLTRDGQLNIDDVLAFLEAFANSNGAAQYAAPFDELNIDDVLGYLSLYAAGCF